LYHLLNVIYLFEKKMRVFDKVFKKKMRLLKETHVF